QRLHSELVAAGLHHALRTIPDHRSRIDASRDVSTAYRTVNGPFSLKTVADRHRRRHVREVLVGVYQRARGDRGRIEGLKVRALVLVIHARACDEVEPIVEGDRALSEEADAEVVELRERRRGADREGR